MNKIAYPFFFVLVAVVSCCNEPVINEPVVTAVTYVSKQVRSTKRGINFNTLYAADFNKLKNGVSWAYNWGAGGYNSTLTDVAKDAQVIYFPMFWDSLSVAKGWIDKIRSYKLANPDCMYILAYNEPNLTSQANMTPSEAAGRWHQIKDLAKELDMKIVAPAMNYGTLPDYNDPIKWLDEFFEQPGVSIDDVDALAVHCYMNSPVAVKNYIERFRVYDKPVWLTEFSAGESEISAEEQRLFMCYMLNYLESEPIIERYAWFKYDSGGSGAGGDVVERSHSGLRVAYNSNGELTDLGKVYIYFSSMDKELYYAQDTVIPVEHYSNCNASEMVGMSGIRLSPQLKVSSDGGILDIVDADPDVWMEYQIAPEVSGGYQLVIRYASADDSKIKIYINGNEISEIALPKTGSSTTWTTITTSSISLAAGNQTVRIKPSQGILSLNWWKFTK
jgi:hypothetical protein